MSRKQSFYIVTLLYKMGHYFLNGMYIFMYIYVYVELTAYTGCNILCINKPLATTSLGLQSNRYLTYPLSVWRLWLSASLRKAVTVPTLPRPFNSTLHKEQLLNVYSITEREQMNKISIRKNKFLYSTNTPPLPPPNSSLAIIL